MLKAKQIENPEVPGMEEKLTPPPPPTISEADKVKTEPKISEVSEVSSSDTKSNETPPKKPIVKKNPAAFRIPKSSLSIREQSQQIKPNDQPWWIPTADDNQWLAPFQTSKSVNEVKSPQNLKRKSDCMDSKLNEIEKVAAAGALQQELDALIKPLRCDLCNAVMNSPAQAKLHFEGKPHQKKVTMFLNQNAKKVKLTDESSTAADSNTYCDTCKAWFTSQIDASQHYAGKKHIKAVAALKTRELQTNSNQLPADSTGRFGIGNAFLPVNQDVKDESSVAAAVVVPAPDPSLFSGYANGATTYGTALRCDLCGVSTNRLEQLENHKRGARHQRMLKLNGVPTDTVVTTAKNTTTGSTIDYSIHRTPTGSYYCSPCNKSLDSENNFAQHVESKKHKNQLINQHNNKTN